MISVIWNILLRFAIDRLNACRASPFQYSICDEYSLSLIAHPRTRTKTLLEVHSTHKKFAASLKLHCNGRYASVSSLGEFLWNSELQQVRLDRIGAWCKQKYIHVVLHFNLLMTTLPPKSYRFDEISSLVIKRPILLSFMLAFMIPGIKSDVLHLQFCL